MKHLFLGTTLIIGIILSSCSNTPTGSENNEDEDTTRYKIAVTVSPADAGTISPDAEGTYDEGESVSLQAKPSEDYVFEGWTGDVESNNNPLAVTVDRNYSLTANFVKKTYELTINTTGEGTVTERVVQEKTKEYEHGTIVELTATPADGYRFVEWQEDLTSAENPAQITVDEPKEVTAVFEKRIFDLTVNTEGEGSVSKDPDQMEYEYNTTVNLTAKPIDGWEFVEWQGDVTGSENPTPITIDRTKEVNAIFKRIHSVNISIEGSGKVNSIPNKANYIIGSEVKLTAIADEGWKFATWKGDITGTNNPQNLIVDSDKSVIAAFEKKKYDVLVSIEGDGAVDRSPDKSSYYYNDEVQFTALANSGSVFIRWEGTLSGNENPTTLNITEPTSLKAIFKTYEEALVSFFSPSILIGGRVHQASLTLTNELPDPVLLEKIIIRRGDGRITAQSDIGENISSNSSLGFSLSFGVTPTLDQFNEYSVEWMCEYKSKAITKIGMVSTASKAKVRYNSKPVIELQADH